MMAFSFKKKAVIFSYQHEFIFKKVSAVRSSLMEIKKFLIKKQ